ncbi:MAG: Hsp70 family protein [Desulfamplus sp.]|nr:Hsp70 family protein [Desulfamplus sp.]
MSKSIGIDLGTTNSVAAIKKVHTEIIKNAEGEELTPSCVTLQFKKGLIKFFSKENFVVGRHALEWLKQDPANTVTAVKRLMGRSVNDPEVQKIIKSRRSANSIVTHSRGTENSLAIVLGEKEFTPEQLSAKILEKIHRDCEAYLGDDVEYAVITVPAYFNDKQKHATRTAAALAGIKVQRLLPEPTAAAISFGVDNVENDDARTVLVFDFGGGTFDISVLTISGGQFIEQGKGGNMWMGGEDIDYKLIDYVLSRTSEEYEIEDIHAFINDQETQVKNRFSAELKRVVEQAKIDLSDREKTTVELLGLLKDSDGDLVDIDVDLTRDKFEEIIAPVVEGAMGLVKKLLEQIHFTTDIIDNVLLVGGSSRIPSVIRAVKDIFGEEKVLLHKRPMLAIAEGAAILSHRLSDALECPGCGVQVSQSEKSCPDCGFDLDSHMISHSVYDIIHSAAHDYHICLDNGEKYLLIEKNTPLPCERTERFRLVHKYQKLVNMKFVNMVNDEEESIGDLWLGIDDSMREKLYEKWYEWESGSGEGAKEEDSGEKPFDPESPLSVDVTLRIDENNLVEVAASIVELPDAEISKTLSRGKADEKLFIALEELINETNAGDYDSYETTEITSRTIMIISDINKVIDDHTGEVIEPVYELAQRNIETARKLVSEGITCQSLIYYCEHVLQRFGVLIPPGERERINKKKKHLEDMMLRGTYQENVDAYEALDKVFDKSPMISVLMTLEKAVDLCREHEPARSAKFVGAIHSLTSISDDEGKDAVAAKFEKAMSCLPEARELIAKYDNIKAKIYKGITK